MSQTQDRRRGIVLFVHGFGSSSRCWAPLTTLLADDPAIAANYELRTWDYPTKWVELNLLGRIPRLAEVGRALGDEIDSPAYRGRPLTLVGHSQGGLVIMSYLVDLLNRGEASRLRNVRQVICLATPFEGSTTGMSFRRIASALFRNPQELTLRVLNPDVADLRAAMRERMVMATRDTGSSWRVPIHAFSGMQDDVVPEASARGPMESVRRVPGDHFSILRPKDRADRRYTEFAEVLLDPGGHVHRFEIEEYETVLRVAPCAPDVIAVAGKNRRQVYYDNTATMRRTVRFAPSNRCRNPFTLRYGTRSEGYIVAQHSHPNEAPPADMGRWEDTGTFYQFDVRPEPGGTYWFNVEIYRGYGPGDRDVHFHLGDHSHYRRLIYVLDLSAYVAAGYAVSSGPHAYVQPEDLPHTDLCRNRTGLAAVAPTEQSANGVYRWELTHLAKGVVDIVWDVVPAPAAADAVAVLAEPQYAGV